MSTLTTASEVITSTNAIIPVSIDNVPIKYDGNPAHVAGVALEVMRFYERMGHFKPLLKMGAVLLPSGKLAIDSIQAIPFITDAVKDPVTYGFMDPCPRTDQRIHAYDDDADLNSTPKFKRIMTAPSGSLDSVIVSLFTVEKEETALLNSFLQVFDSSCTDCANELVEQAKGEGREFIRLFKGRVPFSVRSHL